MGVKEAVESFDKEKKMSEILNFKGEDFCIVYLSKRCILQHIESSDIF